MKIKKKNKFEHKSCNVIRFPSFTLFFFLIKNKGKYIICKSYFANCNEIWKPIVASNAPLTMNYIIKKKSTYLSILENQGDYEIQEEN